MKLYKTLSRRSLLWLWFGQPCIGLIGAIIYALGGLGYMIFVENRHMLPKDFAGLFFMFVLVGVAIFCISRLLAWPASLMIAMISFRHYKKIKLEIMFAASPFLALLLWCGYDHFIPDGGFPTAAHPYEHGLTWTRFGIAWLIEIVVACAYWFPLRKLR